MEIRYLLDKIQEIDLAFARAGYAWWMNRVCRLAPGFTPTGAEEQEGSFSTE